MASSLNFYRHFEWRTTFHFVVNQGNHAIGLYCCGGLADNLTWLTCRI
jgi:hypothetical protein